MLLALTLGITACAPGGPSGVTAKDPGSVKPTPSAESGVTCTEEETTGSHFTHTVCRDRTRREDEQRQAADLLQRPHNHVTGN
jgi:hypothetical protein